MNVLDVYILNLNNSLYILLTSLFLNSAKHMLIWKLLPVKLQLDVSPGAESIVNCYHVCMLYCALCLLLEERGKQSCIQYSSMRAAHKLIFDTVFCYSMGLWPSKCFLLCTSFHSLSILCSNISLVLQTILHKLCESFAFMYSWTSFHQEDSLSFWTHICSLRSYPLRSKL